MGMDGRARAHTWVRDSGCFCRNKNQGPAAKSTPLPRAALVSGWKATSGEAGDQRAGVGKVRLIAQTQGYQIKDTELSSRSPRE